MLSLVTNIPFVTQLSDVNLLSGKLAKSAPNHHGDTLGLPGLFEKDRGRGTAQSHLSQGARPERPLDF